MRTYNATEFKQKCLRMLDHLSAEGVVVTKRGKPVARVLPFNAPSLDSLYGCMKDKVTVKGNVMSTGIKWHAEH